MGPFPAAQYNNGAPSVAALIFRAKLSSYIMIGDRLRTRPVHGPLHLENMQPPSPLPRTT